MGFSKTESINALITADDREGELLGRVGAVVCDFWKSVWAVVRNARNLGFRLLDPSRSWSTKHDESAKQSTGSDAGAYYHHSSGHWVVLEEFLGQTLIRFDL